MADPNMEKLAVNGMKPFFSHSDGVSERIGEAHALLLILASAYRESEGEENCAESRASIQTINPSIVAAALDGIAALIALSLYHQEAIDGKN